MASKHEFQRHEGDLAVYSDGTRHPMDARGEKIPAPPAKLSRVDRLKADLAKAKDDLAVREPGLLASLREAEAEIGKKRAAYDAARAAAKAAYDALELAQTEEGVALGIITKHGAATDALLLQIHAFASANGLPGANLFQLAEAYIAKTLASLPRIVELKAARQDAETEETRKHAAWNVADSPNGRAWKLRRTLGELRDRVARLEKEIAATPRRNESRREARAEERAQEAKWAETNRAKELLESFTFAKPEVG